MPNTQDLVTNKKDENPCPHGLLHQCGETDKNKINR